MGCPRDSSLFRILRSTVLGSWMVQVPRKARKFLGLVTWEHAEMASGNVELLGRSERRKLHRFETGS